MCIMLGLLRLVKEKNMNKELHLFIKDVERLNEMVDFLANI